MEIAAKITYNIEVGFIIPGIDYMIYPDYINKLTKSCNFIDDYSNTSFFTIDCIVNKYLLRSIQKHEKDILINIKIVKIIEMLDKNIPPIKLIEHNEDMIPFFDQKILQNTSSYIDKNVENIDTDLMLDPVFQASGLFDVVESQNTEQVEDNVKSDRNIIFAASSVNYKTLSKLFINKIISNKGEITVANAITSLIFNDVASNSELIPIDLINRGVIIDTPDNKLLYRDIRIYPLEFFEVFRYLQIQYGIYVSGLKMFYDNGIFYILKRFSDKYLLSEKQSSYFIIRVINDDAMENFNGDSLHFIESDDENSDWINLYSIQDIPQIKNESSLLGEMIEDSLFYTNDSLIKDSLDLHSNKWNSPLIRTERNSVSHKFSGNKTRFHLDSMNNPYNFMSYLLSKEMNKEVSFTIENCDISLIKPNIFFILSTEKNNENNGKYMMKKAEIIFVPDDEDPKLFYAQGIIHGLYTNYIKKFEKNNESLFKSNENQKYEETSSLLKDNIIRLDNNKSDDYKSLDVSKKRSNEDYSEAIDIEDIVINLANIEDYSPQLDNKPGLHDTKENKEKNYRIGIRTCNLTSATMSFLFNPNMELPSKHDEEMKKQYKSINPNLSPQLEDYFYRNMITNAKVIEFFKEKVEDKMGDPYYNNIDKIVEFEHARHIFFNDFFNEYGIYFYTKYINIANIVYNIVYNKIPMLISGRFPSIKNGNFKYISHIVCVSGVITKQSNIYEIKNINDVNINDIKFMIINDPYGNPMSEYTNNNGRDVYMPIGKFDYWVRNSNGYKMTQYFDMK